MREFGDLQLQDLYAIIDPKGEIERFRLQLEASNLPQAATILLKLQQDAGLELNPAFDPQIPFKNSGEKTQKIWEDFQPVTMTRYKAALQMAHKALLPPSSTLDL